MSEVKLILHLHYTDGHAKFEKQAPKLPDGVCWHEGMTFCVDAECDCQVGSVMCDALGNVRVIIDNSYSGLIGNDDFSFLTSNGWTQIAKRLKPNPA